MSVLQKEAKKRRDSIEQYGKANRQDLVDEETNELKIIQDYLPKEISDEELDLLVKDAIDKTGAKELKDMGKVIPVVIKASGGSADGARISTRVKQILEG